MLLLFDSIRKKRKEKKNNHKLFNSNLTLPKTQIMF